MYCMMTLYWICLFTNTSPSLWLVFSFSWDRWFLKPSSAEGLCSRGDLESPNIGDIQWRGWEAKQAGSKYPHFSFNQRSLTLPTLHVRISQEAHFHFKRGLDSQNGLKTTESDEFKAPFKSIILEFCSSFWEYNKMFPSWRKNEINLSQSCDIFHAIFIHWSLTWNDGTDNA